MRVAIVLVQDPFEVWVESFPKALKLFSLKPTQHTHTYALWLRPQALT